MRHAHKRSNISSFLILILTFFIGWQASSFYHTQNAYVPVTPILKEEKQDTPIINDTLQEEELALFFDVWDLLREKYVDEHIFDNEEQIYGAINGLVDSLGDPYTVFMTPNQSEDFQANLEGKLEGIGAELTIENQALVIVSPIKGSPAERAGLKPGDIIYKIENEIAAEMSLFEAIMKIRGEKGTIVHVTIVRESVPDPIEMTIMRDSINLKSVDWEEKEDGVIYLSINQFSDNTKSEFQKAVSEILLKDPKGIILDLRYNGGGYLDIAIDILGELIKGKRKAVSIKQRNGNSNEIMYIDGNARISEIPLVVLVNYGSASASEIVAGAIQDNKRGLIIGEQTFGKGSVQEVDSLKDGSSLRITIARWFTPSERTIDHVGITPDRIVVFTEEDYEKGEDPQLKAALEYFRGL